MMDAEVKIGYWLTYGNWPDRDPRAREIGFDPEGIRREAYKRLFLIRKAESLGIAPAPEHVSLGVRNLISQLTQGSRVDLLQFERGVLIPAGLSLDDFAAYVKHNIMINQLALVVGSVGSMLLPGEIDGLYAFENREVVAKVVPVLATNYLDKIKVEESALLSFYTNHIDRYTLPERVQVKYVRFALTNYYGQAWEMLKTIPGFSNEVERVYQRLVAEKQISGSPEEAKGRIITNYMRRVAMDLAMKNANAIGRVLFDHQPLTIEEFEKIVTSSNLVVSVTGPFSRDEVPAELDVDSRFVRVAFSLSTNQPVSEPIEQFDGVYILALYRRLPVEVLAFNTVRDRVERDFRWREGVRMAQEEGEQLYGKITNGLAMGKSFDQVCSELRLRVISPKSFARNTQYIPEIEEFFPVSMVKEVSFGLRVGECSRFVPTTNGGFIVFVADRLPLDSDKMRVQLPQFRNTISQVARMELFQAWMRENAKKELSDLPVFKR